MLCQSKRIENVRRSEIIFSGQDFSACENGLATEIK